MPDCLEKLLAMREAYQSGALGDFANVPGLLWALIDHVPATLHAELELRCVFEHRIL